jgi:hypothetical protein
MRTTNRYEKHCSINQNDVTIKNDPPDFQEKNVNVSIFAEGYIDNSFTLFEM